MKRDLKSYSTRLQDDQLAEKYARRFEQGGRKRIDRREQRAVRKVFAGLLECRTVLDVPSGAGRFLGSLGETGRTVIEIDVAREILTHAEGRARQAGVKAHFVHADASRLPLRNGAVDAVFCNRLLHHLLKPEERVAVLHELHRVARMAVVVSFFDYKSFGIWRMLFKAIKGSKPKYEGQPSLAEFAGEIRECGFRIAEIVPTGGPWVSQKYLVLEKI